MTARVLFTLVCGLCFSVYNHTVVSAEAETNAFSGQIERLTQDVRRHQFDSGLVCIIKEDWSAPLVSIQVWIGAGSAQEDEYLGGGLSHLIEHMIFKGTPQRRPADIARQIDDAGGTINAYTSLDRTVFWVDMPAEHWQTGLDVLADAVTHASFPADEWRREKDVVRREMAMGKDNPDRVLSKLLWQTAYRVHPYRFPVIGLEDIFNTLTRDDLVAFFRRNYLPDNMIITVVGSVKADSALATVENRFRGVGRRARPLPAQTEEPPQLSQRSARKTGAYNISRLAMAWHTVGLSHPDAPALDILSIITGGGRSSRLNQKIKENQKLAFNIDAWSFTPKDTGLFGISADFDPANEDDLLKAITAEVATWQTNLFSAAEVEKARNKIAADTLLAFQTLHGQADTFASGEFYAGTPFYFDTYLKRLSTVTPESLAAAANRYLPEQNRTLVILSPGITNESVAKIGPEPTPACGHPSPGGDIKKFKDNTRIPSLEGCPLASAKHSGGAGTGRMGQPDGTSWTNVVKTVFPNGLTLLAREDNRLPFVQVCVASLGGLLMENDRNNGITCLMAELLTRGTKERTQEQIANAVERKSGSISSFSGINSYGLQARCFSRDAELFMDILSDCCLRSVFAEEEIAKCKAIQVSRIEQQYESPMFLAQEAMRKELFAGHPYRLNMEGTRASVMAVTREELFSLHAKTAAGSNTVIAVFGDIATVKARELVEKFLGKMPAGQKQDMQSCGNSSFCHSRESGNLENIHSDPGFPIRSGMTNIEHCSQFPRQIELTAPREQTIVLAGFPGLAVVDKRIDAVNILLQALNGLSSDLMISVRDKKGLAYYTGAYHKAGLAGGQLVVYAGTRAEEVSHVKELIIKEINRIAGKGIRADEFKRARMQIISEGRQSRQNAGAFARECALNELYGLGYAHKLETERRLAQLAPDDARQAAAEIMRPEKMVEVIVKPGIN
ncbi:MAG: pitrilysin family protein, partial [Kiritimatiellia bacterium]|nr:pitrilysin family protein [Kiritimatiellia bacterium]